MSTDNYLPERPHPALVKVSYVCKQTSLGRTTVYELIRSGRLEAVKVGRSTRVTGSSLAAFVDGLRRQRGDA